MLSSKRINGQKQVSCAVKTDTGVDPNKTLFPIVWKMSVKKCNFLKKETFYNVLVVCFACRY
jgi:hypothetical protein